MKRVLTLLLVASMLLSAAACSDNGASETTASDETAANASADNVSAEDIPAETSRADVKDNLPEISFDGREYRAASTTGTQYEFYSEEITGEATNDAIYNRNLLIEDRFDTKIVPVEYSGLGAIVSDVATLVAAGTDAYEVVSHCSYKAYTPIRARAYRNWLEVENIDLTQPWWNDLANSQSTINGFLYTITGDINISSLLNTYAMFFNIDLAEDYGITAESLYNSVYEGTWTVDKFIATTSAIYQDQNGNGTKDDTDTYGFAAWPGISADAWLAAFDQPISGKDENGFPTPLFMSDKTVSAVEKISNFYYNTEGCYADMGSAEYEVTMFVNNQVVMVPSVFNDAFTQYRNMDAAYGIVPYPKWDEAQERYLTNARDQYTVLGIPAFKVDGDLEFIGVITEALAAESYRSVFPQYYDIALKGKYSVDRDTANMVDLVLSGRNFDFAFLFGESEFQRLPYMFRDLLAERSTDVASKYKRLQKVLDRTVAKMSELFMAEE